MRVQEDARQIALATKASLDRVEAQTSAILDNTIALKDMSSRMSLQLKCTERVLLNAAVEGVDITCPSCSLIVNAPYLPLGSAEMLTVEEAERAANVR